MVDVESGNAGTTSDLKCNSPACDVTVSPRRRRSVSLASPQPSVETVVVKAKRAASTLWTLLHAKNCVLAERCVHLGCREANILHLHLKTCVAGEGFPCPSSRHGCDQARKLLGHYRRCRNTRARQVLGQQTPPSVTRRDQQQQPVCLVCSLVARQARSLLDQPPSTTLRTLSSSSSSSSAPVVATRPSPAATATVKKPNRRVVTSFMLNDANMVVMPPPTMPPPPPRTLAMPPVPVFRPEPGMLPTAPLYPPPNRLPSMKPHESGGLSGIVVPFQEHSIITGIRLSTMYGSGASTPPEEETGERKTYPSQQQNMRNRSDSVGDATVLLSASSLDPACDTIDEEPEHSSPSYGF